jgi:hypothetical protein
MSDAPDPLPALPVGKSGRNLVVGALLALAVAGIAVALVKAGKPKPRPPKVHRAVAAPCGPSPRTQQRDPTLAGCSSDADCSQGKNGHCEKKMVKHASFENRCVYDGCSMDDDCERADEDPLSTRIGDGPCICGTEGRPNACFDGNCRTDDDCGSNFCSPSRDFNCGYEGTPGYYCHTDEDECVDDADCADAGSTRSPQCRYDSEAKRWRCSASECHRF